MLYCQEITLKGMTAIDIIDEIEAGEKFLNRVMFSGEATFHNSGHVDRHNVQIWTIRDIVKHEHDGQKVNFWCTLTADRIIGRLLFAKSTVNEVIFTYWSYML